MYMRISSGCRYDISQLYKSSFKVLEDFKWYEYLYDFHAQITRAAWAASEIKYASTVSPPQALWIPFSSYLNN